VTDVRDTDGDRIKIWYLIGTLAVGGTEKTLIDLVSGLNRERFAPTIWTIAEPGPLAEEVPSDVSVRSLSATSKADVRAVVRLIRALRREQPEILQSFLFFDNVLARLTRIAAPETAVITGVRMVPETMPWHRAAIDRLTMPLSDFVVSNSRAGADWVIEQGADPNRVRVVYNGRKPESYAVSIPEKYRYSLGIPDGPVVGTVGRLVELKGHHDLLEAWPRVKTTHSRAQLVIVGEGPQRESLAERAEQLGIESSVHLLGRRDDVPELLSLFDVFVFPSRVEGLPGALLEAMCAGLPIITTPAGGSSELVTDGVHGIHVPIGEIEPLSDAVNRLLENGDLAAELCENAQARAKLEFSLESMVEGFESVYKELD